MGRTILGAALGLVTAFLTIMLIEYFGHMLYPPPPGLNPMDTAQMASILQSQPLPALLIVVAAWTLGAFEGGLVAALIAREQRPTLAALVPAVLVVAGVVGMIVQMPGHPMWMAVAGLLLPIPAALAGAKLAARLRHKG